MFLGLDIGTSEVKALLLDDAHHVHAVTGAPLTVQRPQPGHSEQDPEHWWQATQAAAAALRKQQPRAYAAIKAIGLSGQMHGATLLDAHDRVLRPAILWNDTRAADECVAMMQAMPALANVAGSLAMPGFTAPKLRWVMSHEPQLYAQVRKVLLPKDYVRLKLTGDHVTDMSDASGTLWLNVAKRAWSAELLALTGFDERQMPRLVEGSDAAGPLNAAAAAALHLTTAVVVAGGGGDNAASAVGMGCVAAGNGFVSLGTSGVIFVVTPGFAPNAASATHAFCHALPRLWHQMSVMLTAASALQWAARLVGAASPAELEAAASTLSAAHCARAPLFLPYLSGERTPHNDAQVRGSLHGLDHDTDAAALGYAVIEGVSFGLADGLRALQAAGSDVAQLSLVGGGARSERWAQLLASCLNVPIVTHEASSAGGALGAARLAWLATGAPVSAVCAAPAIAKRFVPDAQEQALLAPRLAKFRALYAGPQAHGTPTSQR